MNAEVDTGGHTWEGLHRDDGQPLLLMRCTACEKVWHPDQTLRQIGRCPTPITPPITSSATAEPLESQ